jgi:hypothetical protein
MTIERVLRLILIAVVLMVAVSLLGVLLQVGMWLLGFAVQVLVVLLVVAAALRFWELLREKRRR